MNATPMTTASDDTERWLHFLSRWAAPGLVQLALMKDMTNIHARTRCDAPVAESR
jgi:hypothetical protein